MDDKEILTIKKISHPITIIKYLKNLITKKTKPKIFFNFVSVVVIILILVLIIVILLNEQRHLIRKLDNIKYKEETIHLSISNNNFEKVKIIKRLFNIKEDKIQNIINKNQIHISYSLDNNLIYPTFISMISGLENNNNKINIIIFHLLLSHDFDESKFEIFESLKDKYEVKINYYIIPHLFSFTKTWTSGTDCIYYKIFIPIIFPDLKRIIHLDGDTLIRKDLLEMYNLPFNDNYILGFPFYMPYVMDKFGINATHYITVGCILYNLEKIYNDKKDVDLLQFTIKNNSKLSFPEQDAINYIFYPNIGFLPLKYGIYMIGNHKIFERLSHNVRTSLNLREGYKAVDDPSIIHFSCCWPKVWSNGSKNLFGDDNICLRYQKEFYYYASKTKYYSIIYNTLYNNLK
jgi:lipopolysaccharide biosynthesis glycosyltransferase